MAAIDFPASPSNGQVFTAPNGNVYIFKSTPSPGLWVAQIAGSGTGLPVGTVCDYAGAVAPTGWLFCNGQSITVAAFSSLHAVIGYTYGGALANFNVPDLRGRVVAGLESGGSNRLNLMVSGSDTLGGVGGVQEHVLGINQIPSHDHGISAWGSGSAIGALDSGASNNVTILNANLTGARGGGLGHNTVQPTLMLNKIIKT